MPAKVMAAVLNDFNPSIEAQRRLIARWACSTMIKVWFWMEIQKNAIVREIKRVELQVANLAAAMRSTKLIQ